MCKHVAATLYGVGARLDAEPDLLFRLRAVDAGQIFANLDAALPASRGGGAGTRLDAGDLSDIFGIELAASAPSPISRSKAGRRRRRSRRDGQSRQDRRQRALLRRGRDLRLEKQRPTPRCQCRRSLPPLAKIRAPRRRSHASKPTGPRQPARSGWKRVLLRRGRSLRRKTKTNASVSVSAKPSPPVKIFGARKAATPRGRSRPPTQSAKPRKRALLRRLQFASLEKLKSKRRIGVSADALRTPVKIALKSRRRQYDDAGGTAKPAKEQKHALQRRSQFPRREKRHHRGSRPVCPQWAFAAKGEREKEVISRKPWRDCLKRGAVREYSSS